MIPGATEEQMRWLDELQRVSVSAENAVAARRQRSKENVVGLLPQLDQPTLVLHCRGDRMNDFEEGRFLASNIANSRLVPLESSNHIVLGDEPAWGVVVDEVAGFLEPDRQPEPRRVVVDVAAKLSPRELDVLRLAAEGEDNDAIAERLTLSVRTIERHLHNVYTKLDLHGKSARAAAVSRLLTRA